MDTKELCGKNWPGWGWGDGGTTTSDRSFSPSDYFVGHMGDYEDVLASLETLNHSVLKAMGYTKKVRGLRGDQSAGSIPDFSRRGGHSCLRGPDFDILCLLEGTG